MFDYKKIVSELHQPLVDLTCTLSAIPSPSYDEWRKADYIVNYFKDLYPNKLKEIESYTLTSQVDNNAYSA